MVNRDWIEIFGEAMVEHLNLEVLDHAPILLNTSENGSGTEMRPFQLLEAWTSDESSSDVVKEAWNNQVRRGMEAHKVQCRLNATAKALHVWNINHFGISHESINALE